MMERHTHNYSNSGPARMSLCCFDTIFDSVLPGWPSEYHCVQFLFQLNCVILTHLNLQKNRIPVTSE